MNVRALVLVVVVALLAAACDQPEDTAESSGTWVGTITIEGNVTTVVNESGSVWGGPARLVEELSIGVESGDPAYMLGPAAGVWDAGDRIVYVDASVPTVRVYDGDGVHLGDVGREGQGPGEYTFPYSGAALPDGRIVLTNAGSGWVDLFDRDLQYLERWGPYPDELTASGARLLHALVVGTDQILYLSYRETQFEPSFVLRSGWRAIGPDGLGPVVWRPEFEFEELQNCYRADCGLYGLIRYSPGATSALLPSGDVVGGLNDEYSFEIHHADGSITTVRRQVDAVQLSDEEWEYWMADRRADALLRSPDWSPDWSDEVPRTKPAFQRFYPARDGRILVRREGPSERVEPCTEDPVAADGDEIVPCWRGAQVFDMFDADGRFLGEITPPRERLLGAPHVDGDRLTTAVEDEAGTIMVKRYRLVLPGEGGR